MYSTTTRLTECLVAERESCNRHGVRPHRAHVIGGARVLERARVAGTVPREVLQLGKSWRATGEQPEPSLAPQVEEERHVLRWCSDPCQSCVGQMSCLDNLPDRRWNGVVHQGHEGQSGTCQLTAVKPYWPSMPLTVLNRLYRGERVHGHWCRSSSGSGWQCRRDRSAEGDRQPGVRDLCPP